MSFNFLCQTVFSLLFLVLLLVYHLFVRNLTKKVERKRRSSWLCCSRKVTKRSTVEELQCNCTSFAFVVVTAVGRSKKCVWFVPLFDGSLFSFRGRKWMCFFSTFYSRVRFYCVRFNYSSFSTEMYFAEQKDDEVTWEEEVYRRGSCSKSFRIPSTGQKLLWDYKYGSRKT